MGEGVMGERLVDEGLPIAIVGPPGGQVSGGRRLALTPGRFPVSPQEVFRDRAGAPPASARLVLPSQLLDQLPELRRGDRRGAQIGILQVSRHLVRVHGRPPPHPLAASSRRLPARLRPLHRTAPAIVVGAPPICLYRQHRRRTLGGSPYQEAGILPIRATRTRG